MLSSPRAHPSLPQNDNPGQQRQRRDQLEAAGQAYQWNDQAPTLRGVPLAAAVPRADQPTVAWLLDVVETAIDIAANQLLVKISGGDRLLARSGGSPLLTYLDTMRHAVDAIRRDHETAAGSLLGVAEHAADVLIGVHRIGLNAKLDALQKLVEANYLGADDAAHELDQYRNLFISLPLPEIADEFMQNDAFARMRVAGPNSVLLRGVDALPEKFALTPAQYRQSMGNGDELDAALSERRLYLLDYAELALVPGTTAGKQKYVISPIALFAVPRGGRSLIPVAIQLGQDPGGAQIVLRADSASDAHWWQWQLARTFVQVAEGNYHELFVHLARTHLVIEAFAVATHRMLAPEHPLNVLLLPHFEGTLFINDLAAGRLIAAGGPIDRIFAGTITSTQEAASHDRLTFDFYAHMLPADLAHRRVEDAAALPDYPYRDDATLVWNAIHQWVDDYVSVYYADDTAVTADYELSAWTEELRQQGRIAGFRPIDSRVQLVDVLTMIMFTASAQHAAVNFPQRTLMSYAPAISGAAWSPLPGTGDTFDETAWLASMPPLPEAQQQLNTLWLLGSVHYRPLGDYRLNDWPYPEWFQDPRIVGKGGPLQRFQAALKTIDAEIDARNLRRTHAYGYLKPSLIPTSINI